jgi:hypothetical protein
MSVFTRTRVPVAPSGEELLPRKPPPPLSASAVARKRAQEVNEARERERVAAREAADAERTRESLEQRERLEDAAQRQRREWAQERERLRGELDNAEAAHVRCCGQAIDLATPDAAMRSVQSMSLRDAAARLVEKAEQALAAHERSR